MLSRQIIVICCLLLSASAFAANANFQQIELKQYLNQQPISLSTISNGKPIYLKFWATWCQPCMEQMPHFQALQQKYQDRINIVALNININEQVSEISRVIERFGLTMPVWLDNEGEMGVALGLVGTPYSVLINRAGDVVYTSHESDSKLDKFIELLANGQELTTQRTKAPTTEQTAALLKPWLQGEHVLFLTATWCDWYLADSRPAMAKECMTAQKGLNDLIAQLPHLPWHGVVNHLWTDDKAVVDFKQQYQLQVEFTIDTAGVLFNHFNIRQLPTILWLTDGKIQQRINDFSRLDNVARQLSKP